MFTGIIESLAKLVSIEKNGDNITFTFNSKISNELKIDQSLAHNGICLTVIDIKNDNYSVVAIKETVLKTSIKNWKVGDSVNIERAMKMGARLDGHMVQGHVDQIAVCDSITEENGSWYLNFLIRNSENITIEKGSIAINGVSLTVVDSKKKAFQ